MNDLATIDLNENRYDKARAEILQAIEWRRKVLAANPKDSQSRQFLDDYLALLIRAVHGLGHTDLASDPELIDDRQAQHLYNAACAAVLAALLPRSNASELAGDGKTMLRAHAIAWLKSELAAWREFATTGGRDNKALVAKTLDRWKHDTDLADARDAAGLAELPEPERKKWKDLWNEVEALRASVALE